MLPSRHELSDPLGALCDAPADPSPWDPLIQQLAKRTGATSAALVMHDFAGAFCSIARSWELNPGFLITTTTFIHLVFRQKLSGLHEEHYHTLDVWAQRASAQREFVFHSQSVCPLSELQPTELCNELFVPSGIEHAVFAFPENGDSRLFGVKLYRSRPEFTESDLRTPHFLAPYLQRAFKLHFRLSELKARSSGFENALGMVPTGIALLSLAGQIIYMLSLYSIFSWSFK